MAPTDRNRLRADAGSPYLRQHADNPVHWQPWDKQALETARTHDTPIFLSVGYAACHWCHVMAEESFTDPDIATILNEQFVPIKVDREERPDIDMIYQRLCQAATDSGGWPLSVWLTPDGRPFGIGTYYPAEERYGRPAFGTILEQMASAWADDRDDVMATAAEWTELLQSTFAPPAERTNPATPLQTVADTAVQAADRTYGGWGNRTKFPHPARIEALLLAAQHGLSGNGADDAAESYRAVAVETLDAMATGGMYDHLGGGFHRYATDRQWTIPHFEKMLYDNAELARIYGRAYEQLGQDRHREVLETTLAFLRTELSHPEGGFYSTLDARSQPPSERPNTTTEGAYYIWTPEEIAAAVDDSLVPLARQRYGVTERGNFDGNTTVLTIDASIKTLAETFDRSPATIRSELATIREQLATARSTRPRPACDRKVIAGWNGLAIRAFATAGRILETEAYATRAVDGLTFVRTHLWDDGLSRSSIDGDARERGVLADYAFLGQAALACHSFTDMALTFAKNLADRIETQFWDPEATVLWYTPLDGESLLVRPIELADRSVPSSYGAALQFLAAMDHHVDHDRFATIVEQGLETAGGLIESQPLSHPTLALAAHQYQA